MIITSKSNQLIKEISKLYNKKYRKQRGLYLVEGVKPVNECIRMVGNIETIICTEELSELYPNAFTVSRQIFESISSEKTPQGVIAAVKIPDYPLVPPSGNCILLDCLQDPGNLGTIIRTANGCGYNEIYLINCTDPYSAKTVRASMSGIFFVKIYSGTQEDVLSVLNGTPLICADIRGEDIYSFRAPKKYCLCIGNEGKGINKAILDKADHKIKIPMRDTCESLNAGVSAGIAMYTLKYNK